MVILSILEQKEQCKSRDVIEVDKIWKVREIQDAMAEGHKKVCSRTQVMLNARTDIEPMYVSIRMYAILNSTKTAFRNLAINGSVQSV